MKNILSFFIASCACCQAFAQPVLNASAINPVPGDGFFNYNCGVSRVNQGASGSGVLWNYSGLAANSIDTILYLFCSAAPDCDSFPGSTLATYNNSGYDYYITDTGKFALAGEYTGSGAVYYTTPRDIVIYPMTFNDIKVSNYAFTNPTNLWFTHGTDSLIDDAYGTLVLPSGTFNNVLRIHKISHVTDSNIVSGSAIVDSYIVDNYFWYTPGFHNPLLAMYYDLTPGGVPELAQVIYTASNTLGTANTITNENNIQVYPNPVKDILYLKMEGQDVQKIKLRVMDITGKEYAIPVQKTNNISFNVSSLLPGVYVLQVQMPTSVIYKNFVVNKPTGL